MNKEEWDKLQKEFNLQIWDVNYNNLSKESARDFLRNLADKFNDIFNEDEVHDL